MQRKRRQWLHQQQTCPMSSGDRCTTRPTPSDTLLSLRKRLAEQTASPFEACLFKLKMLHACSKYMHLYQQQRYILPIQTYTRIYICIYLCCGFLLRILSGTSMNPILIKWISCVRFCKICLVTVVYLQVRMENKLDEHELLRVQLEALDYQEKHGVLLTEGDFYYRYPQSFDPSARPKPDGEDGQPQWAPFREQGIAGPSLSTVQAAGGQGGGPIYGAQDGGETQSQWQSWLQRQRRRGWYSSTTLVYSTLFGAVVGASNFTTYWQQLQIWRSSMFFLPYLLFLFTVGLPTLQLEVRKLGAAFAVQTTDRCVALQQIATHIVGLPASIEQGGPDGVCAYLFCSSFLGISCVALLSSRTRSSAVGW